MTRPDITIARGIVLLALAGTSVACVHRAETVATVEKPPPPPDRTIHLDPVVVTGDRAQAAISDLNDAELYAIGQAAFGGGDNAKAALYFARLADYFPASTYRPEALFKTGTLLERMKDYAGALTRFLAAAKAYGATVDGGDAQFKAADEYYFLGQYDQAIAILESLATAPYVTGVRQAEADTKRAICLYSAGRLDDAERLLHTTVKEIQDDLKGNTPDGYLPSQALFYLAEIVRQHYLEAKLDAVNRTQPQLLDDLEKKCELLLAAQGYYLRCMRVGHPEWATASGYRVGELYQTLYEQLTALTPSTTFTAEELAAYRKVLRDRIRVLISKAITAYELTLSTAERVGARSPFVQQTQEHLDKMKSLMLDGDGPAAGAPKEKSPASSQSKAPSQS